MECQVCKQDFDPDMAWYENICDDCLGAQQAECTICGDPLMDDDGAVCEYCDIEMLMIMEGGF